MAGKTYQRSWPQNQDYQPCQYILQIHVTSYYSQDMHYDIYLFYMHIFTMA